MTLYCKYFFYFFLLSLLSCLDFGNETASNIPSKEAVIIRDILQVNGYRIDDKEAVDDFLEFSSTSSDVNLKDIYYLILPAIDKHTIVLSDKITALDSSTMFITIKTYRTSRIHSFSNDIFVDSIIINSDSIIKMSSVLDLSKNEIRTIPKTISQLRVGAIDLRKNNLTTLPDEIMFINDQDTAINTRILLDNNQIDTLTLSAPLKIWLTKYANGGKDWWKLQKTYQ